jgi:threonine dehydratase
MTAPQSTLLDVRDAVRRIAPHRHLTPLLTCSTLDRLAGRRLFLKCENLQKTGAFKFRGALNAVMQLDEARAARGVVTHSSGNHGQALALAARIRGIAAHVVMPSTASPVKKNAVAGYGATIHPCDPTEQARTESALAIAARTGATLIPPFDHPAVIAGQGTVALEVIDQMHALGIERPDAIVAPVGGGGLISGISVAAHGIDTTIRVFGSEPEGADDAARSVARGERVRPENPHSIADGLLTGLGDLTWPIVRLHVERIVVVTEACIARAMRLVLERAKLLIEPSAAVAVAAVLSDELKALHGLDRVAVVLSGGNVDLDRLPWAVKSP